MPSGLQQGNQIIGFVHGKPVFNQERIAVVTLSPDFPRHGSCELRPHACGSSIVLDSPSTSYNTAMVWQASRNMKIKILTAGGTIGKERRLCYVGVTRAQRRLTLTLALSRQKWGKPSAHRPQPLPLRDHRADQESELPGRSAAAAAEAICQGPAGKEAAPGRAAAEKAAGTDRQAALWPAVRRPMKGIRIVRPSKGTLRAPVWKTPRTRERGQGVRAVRSPLPLGEGAGGEGSWPYGQVPCSLLHTVHRPLSPLPAPCHSTGGGPAIIAINAYPSMGSEKKCKMDPTVTNGV